MPYKIFGALLRVLEGVPLKKCFFTLMVSGAHRSGLRKKAWWVLESPGNFILRLLLVTKYFRVASPWWYNCSLMSAQEDARYWKLSGCLLSNLSYSRCLFRNQICVSFRVEPGSFVKFVTFQDLNYEGILKALSEGQNWRRKTGVIRIFSALSTCLFLPMTGPALQPSPWQLLNSNYQRYKDVIYHQEN